MADLHREAKVEPTFESAMFGLDWPRPQLYQRINMRCDEMLRRGLLQEVDALERKGFGESNNALNTVGYIEALSYRRGELVYEEFVRLFKQNTRRYAKRQLTWFRRDHRVRWIPVAPDSDLHAIAARIALLFRQSLHGKSR
jgi:tRNA dimethylallyltransferase